MSKPKFSFASIIGMVAIALGRKPEEISAGSLSEDEKQLLTQQMGADFVAKFEAESAKSDKSESANVMLAALRSHFDAEAKAGIDAAFAKLDAMKLENEKLAEQVAKLSGQSEQSPEAQFPEMPAKAGALTPFKINARSSHYAHIAQAMTNPNLGIEASADTIHIEDAKAEFKTFLGAGSNNNTLVTQVFNGFTSAKEFRTIRVKDKYHKAIKAQVNSVVQKFSKYFTPKGDFKFTPMVIETFHHKINVVFTPADIIDSYIDHLYDQSLRPDQMPISNFIWNSLIAPRISEDLEYRMVFKGKYDDDTDPKKPTDPEQSMNGIEIILVNAKADPRSNINFYDQYVNIVTATDDQMIAHARGFAQFIKKHKLKIDKIYCSDAYRTRYVMAYDNKFKGNSGVAGEINADAKIDYSPARFVALDGMGTSPILYATVAGNKVKTRKKNQEPNVINDIQRQDYDIKFFGEFNMGVGFEFEELVYACVPANYDPQAELEDSTAFPDGTKPETGSSGSSGSGQNGLG